MPESRVPAVCQRFASPIRTLRALVLAACRDHSEMSLAAGSRQGIRSSPNSVAGRPRAAGARPVGAADPVMSRQAVDHGGEGVHVAIGHDQVGEPVPVPLRLQLFGDLALAEADGHRGHLQDELPAAAS